ncbi:hypothetical protein [Mycobacteroides abscessus]|uniref:hypothetical protein n=1 Tax=Mycobacteroides abscessus TaxID=36809 RepID=UPI0005DCF1E3|nr:hypothetical protein [Mycobacteroides abscessus]CPW40616.1 Uncharacterised protein [Mycobacteroides abscessus]SKF60061.1 Uncharacterised protein [Mycobacteroides abscessus subsp. bolletii]SKH51677.1 Uncharacterised protein [Mycobacteroides abscessus subsp. bolletii]
MKTHPVGVGDCPAVFGAFFCTRDDGHDGSHMAAGIGEVLAVWDSELAWCNGDREGGLWFGNTGREWVEVAE